MTLVALPGTPLVPIGPGFTYPRDNLISGLSTLVNAAEAAMIMIGHVITSDGNSHTINTSGSSSFGWRTGTSTFANASTTVKVGLAAVDTAAGPPGRAVNAANIITFDVSKSLVGGSGGITSGAWQTHVPDAGTKTIANGDLVAFCVQMTARGGTDSVAVGCLNNSEHSRPNVTVYNGAAYSVVNAVPNVVITFSDGVLGYFYSGEIYSSISTRIWSSSSGTKEYGQLFNLPFPVKIHGIYGWLFQDNAAGDADVVLYSAPLSGSPVAEKTVPLDANTIATISVAHKFTVMFATPYTYAANTDIAAVFKPSTFNSITAYYKTLASASHRIGDPYGASGYGINRSTGAFANANASLEHYFIGLLVGAFDAGGAAGRAVQINNDSLVA